MATRRASNTDVSLAQSTTAISLSCLSSCYYVASCLLMGQFADRRATTLTLNRQLLLSVIRSARLLAEVKKPRGCSGVLSSLC